MHILAINGSARKNGSTITVINQLLDETKALVPHLTSEIVHTADMTVGPCQVKCARFCSENPFVCATSDDTATLLQKMIQADALIIGAPLYFRVPPAKFHTFAERLVSLFYFQECRGDAAQPSPLLGKACALIGVTEYSNPAQVLEYLADFCHVLKLRPLQLDKLPYLGIGAQNDLHEQAIFSPFGRVKEMAKLLCSNNG